MDKAKKLHQAIYDLLATQIEFGTYRYKDPLPKMDEVSQWFSVSLGTVKAAYHQLKIKGYITLTKKAGASVAIQLQDKEVEKNIHTFFSLRKDAVMDLCHSFGLLFSYIQWYGLKNAKSEQLDELERLCTQTKILRPYIMIQHIRLIYGSLNNDLLLRLIWQVFLFFQAPFLSLPTNLVAFEDSDDPLLNMINFCRQKDWDRLWETVASCQEQIVSAIQWFYTNRITFEPSEKPISFYWSIYQNTSQQCYSLAIDILKNVRKGIFTRNDFLPSPTKIAEHMQVSTITVRRTLVLLNQLGTIRTINGVGSKILSVEDSIKNCNISKPIIQERVLDFAKSLQILAITCGACIKSIATVANAADIWKSHLLYIKESLQYESVVFGSLEIILKCSTNQVIREVYDRLLQFLLWGYPLRSMHGSREEINEFYLPHIDFLLESLERYDWDSLASELENMLFYELQFTVTHLNELGIKDVPDLVISKYRV